MSKPNLSKSIPMKSKNTCIFTLLILVLPTTIFSQASNYSYMRKLDKTEKENFYSISLLPEIVANCKSELNDIRLYNFANNDTVEIPYVLEWLGNKNEEKAIPFELINDTHSEKCCSYLTLKFNKKQIINRIKLDVLEANFDKWVKIEGSSDNKNWFTIKEHLRIVRFKNSEEHFEYTTLDFPNSEFAYYRLVINDDGGYRIKISNAYAYESKETTGSYSELKINSRKQTENKKEKTSELIVELPYAYRIDHITINSNSTKDFYRNINLYRSGGMNHSPNNDKENWYLINTSIFSSIENNFINCFNEQIKKLKIEILNYDDAPIEINEIKAFTEQCHLVSAVPASENIYLTYGKANDNAPTYDLMHFREKIPFSITELNYGSEQEIPNTSGTKNASIKKALIENKKWLWTAMGAIILLIGFFSIKLLKKEQE